MLRGYSLNLAFRFQVQIAAGAARSQSVFMPLESMDGIRTNIDLPTGKATVFDILRLKDMGYEVERLPYSLRVLLENASRHSVRVHGALEAAHALAKWPRSIDSETPFMPERVLLQDYTGVPLVVDLAAMRDAARRVGLKTSSINSKVPVDLVIDHSIQVDAWGNDMAFTVNLEKEYERNSERYALLKWAQSAFKGMRVFPPGKGICHQFNLEYLSQVITSSDGMVFPDTLVGTDSHTTMVNGLGVLGWGVGGIEAEAVMLGEPYHMPIPKVYGVKFTGTLREGVTPTDLVLTVTEKLREKNVVGAFVEYFGEGYGQLSVPDRATIGNMSPEYGATSGFFPIDDATLAYLTGTARPRAHVEMVSRYAKQFGFFVSDIEPRYSEVIHIELDKIEPSIAGPRNPEERHTLVSVPSFAHTLLVQRRAPAATPPGATTARSQLMLEEDGPIHAGLNDGAVVIAAITSCTNTSNPTVMVGAGLIAKRAFEAGLAVKPWVKPSLAPGSTVVTDYLQNSGLLPYLDKLGFVLVGYGCTTCIAEGTPILQADGTARKIESMPETGGALVFGPTADGRLRATIQTRKMNNGIRSCVELILQDGRSLVCTPDHMILCSDGRWARADQLKLGKDRVLVGLETPLDTPGADERGFELRAGNFTFRMKTESDRARTLAFARLLGFLHGDGSISVARQGRISAGQAVDREMVLNDIQLITGKRPLASRYDERRWSIVLPVELTRAMTALPGVKVGRRINKPPTLPDFVLDGGCPVAIVREFLGGLFGADGHAPTLHRFGGNEQDSSLGHPAYSRSTTPAHLARSRAFLQELVRLLKRCEVKTVGARTYDYPTRRSKSTYSAPKDGLPRIEVRLQLPDGLSFVEKVGFRYCVDKALCASAAAVYWRLVSGINEQRLWMASRLQELHEELPVASFSKARQLAAYYLLGNEGDNSLSPVVSPHYALLEGYDRFTRLPQREGRKFYAIHRKTFNFPSPSELFEEIGVREWFAPLRTRQHTDYHRYSVEKEATTLPTFSLSVVNRRAAGPRQVYDLTVEDTHAFVAGTVAVHNCIGNSGPLAPEIEKSIKERDLYVVAVLSGNRNFDGRIHPLAKGAFLMSPMLVVAYALAGRIDFDFASTPLGKGKDGKLVYLKDLWPSLDEVKRTVQTSLNSGLYEKRYADAMKGDEKWEKLTSFEDEVYHWDAASTYIRDPPWFEKSMAGSSKSDVTGARVLAVLEDKVTTDHISPAGTIAVDGPAGLYLKEEGVGLLQLSTYGSRRGNHEVMVRGGFSNIRLRNALAKGKEGGYTSHLPEGTVMSIYDAAMKYASEKVPLVILAGKQYGAGSSRDWAAKAPRLLGVRAVIAESFERIHRSNLVAMGVIPLQFKEGEGVRQLGLTGEETIDIAGIASMQSPRQWVDVVARGASGDKTFKTLVRVDNATEMQYVQSGGVLPYVFGRLSKSEH
jgi:aconitase A